MSEGSSNARGTQSQTETSKSSTSVLDRLGPGLITGAADDDPSVIGTYS
jgi:Mn2+/Fe2+ NRAMP family transporter